MGLVQFSPVSGGIDMTKFVPFNKVYTSTGTVTQNNWNSVLSVTGKGLLHYAAVKGIGSTLLGIRVTIDSVVKHYSRASNASNAKWVGIFVKDYIEVAQPLDRYVLKTAYGNINTSDDGINQFFYDYPNVSGDIESNVVIPEPLYFSNSLLIEVANFTNTSNFYYSYAGGTL